MDNVFINEQERRIAQSWCIANNVKIYPVIWEGSKCRIQVDYQGWKQTGEKVFDQKNKKEHDAMYKLISILHIDFYRKR